MGPKALGIGAHSDIEMDFPAGINRPLGPYKKGPRALRVSFSSKNNGPLTLRNRGP